MSNNPHPPTTDSVDEATHIMLVEDDISLAEWICDYLSSQSFLVTLATRGDEAIRLIQQDQPDLVVLDIMLPVKDGLDVCKAVRGYYKRPILMLTALSGETDEVLGLELGADDYLRKPVKPRVLLARIKALLRRDRDDTRSQIREFGQFRIDGHSKTTTLNGDIIPLSSHEFDVLWLLVGKAGQAVSRKELVQQLRGIEYDGFDLSMDILISRLRKKLLDKPEQPYRIKTIWGKGYLFAPDAWFC